MECEVIRINDNTWRMEDGGVRFFLLAGAERALLIDSGMNVGNARDIAAGLTDLPVELLNTHADRDHVGSNGQFPAFYMHPAEEAHYRQGGGQGEIIPIRDGDVLDLGGRKLEIIHLPGHTLGSVAILDGQTRALISGDPIQDGRIFMFGAHRNLRDYADSLERLERRSADFDEIWPSHASFPAPCGLIPKLRDGARDILAGKVRGVPTAFRDMEILVFDLGFATFLCDAGTP